MDAVSNQRRDFVGIPYAKPAEPSAGTAVEDGAQDGRREFKLPSLRSRPTLIPLLDKAAREERAVERERLRELEAVEAARQAFFQTPAGRARIAYKQGHRLFQYELEISDLQPVIVPGVFGSPSRQTNDPVDILNSVGAEGWKLVTGKFVYSEMRGVIGCYLFKRSQKRRLRTNNPWLA